MPVFSSAIAAALAAGALAAGAGVYQGVSAAKSQKKAMGMQEEAQNRALMDAATQRVRAQKKTAEAEAKQPDAASVLAQAPRVPSGSMLTGSTGVAPSSLTLGRNTLLGQ